MGSEYKQASPSLMNLSAGQMGEYGRNDLTPTTPALSIDSMLRDAAPSGAGMSSIPQRYPGYPGGAPNDAGMLPTAGGPYEGQQMMSVGLHNGAGQFPHRVSMSSHPNGQSPDSARHQRLSISSNGPYAAQLRHNSLEGSEPTSTGSIRGRGSFSNEDGIGDNPYAHTSNDTVDSQNQEENSIKQGETHGSQPPPWSELKTKAGKERKRLPLACIACRRKKIRCSGEKPACKHCLRSRIPCVYKVTTRKAAPRTDYMAMLDKRLKRMEERVIKCIPKEELGIVAGVGRAVVKPSLPAAPPKSSGGGRKRAAEQAFGSELDEWANTKPANIVSESSATAETHKDRARGADVDEQSFLVEGADKLPSSELQQHLAEVYFDYVYGQSYHLLHKPSFMRKLAAGTVPPVLTLAMCAISARFSSHPGVRTEPAFLRGEDWASAAREIALRRYDTPNITILIVYLILGLHEFGTCQGGRSWMFGGMAQRMAYALQLHKDLDHDPKGQGSGQGSKAELTFTDREIRRRTMWSCFLMDRFNSSGTDRPLFVNEQYIQAQLPIKEHYFNMEITGPTEDLDGNVPNPVDPDTGQTADARENMGVAAYLIRLVSIWGRLIKYMNLGGKERDKYPMWSEQSMFYEIKNAAATWKRLLPDSLEYTPQNLQNHISEKIANQFLFLHITYNQIILFMNRFAIPTPGTRPSFPKEMPEQFPADAQQAAIEAANQISALINESMDHLVVAPFAGYSAFFSSTVHISRAFSIDAEIQASSKQNLAWNVKYLTKMKKYWGMFHFVAENLKDLYRKHADASRPGPGTGTPKVRKDQETIFQYGDWFDRYPHGVSGTDYEDPAAEIKKEPGADAVLGHKSDLQSVEEFFSKMSPPSKAAQHRKVAKRRHSKSAPKQPQTTEVNSTNQQADMLQNLQAEHFQQHHQTPQIPPEMLQQGFQNNTVFPQQSQAFPPGFNPPHNPLLMHANQQHPGVMSQLDRQMVLSSYAGIDPHSHVQNNTSSQSASNAIMNTGNNFDMDMNTFGANGNNGFWGDPSSAWFMPFNMEPPSIGDDNNLFNSGLDWQNSFGAFGDMNTGLTPVPPPMDMDSGHDGSVNGQNNGMDGMDNLQ